MDDIDPAALRPATDDEILFSLEHGLRYDGKQRIHYADDHMLRIAVAHLLKHLKQSGYVLMKKPPAVMQTNRGIIRRRSRGPSGCSRAATIASHLALPQRA